MRRGVEIGECTTKQRVPAAFTDLCIQYDEKAVLSQEEPRDAAANFDTYRILQRHRTCRFRATTRLSCMHRRGHGQSEHKP